MNKQELKKHEARLRQAQELAENAKRMEQAKKERELREAKRKQIEEARQQRQKWQMSKSNEGLENDESNHAGMSKGARLNKIQQGRPSSLADDDNIIEIKSYHSSEENQRNRKANNRNSDGQDQSLNNGKS